MRSIIDLECSTNTAEIFREVHSLAMNTKCHCDHTLVLKVSDKVTLKCGVYKLYVSHNLYFGIFLHLVFKVGILYLTIFNMDTSQIPWLPTNTKLGHVFPHESSLAFESLLHSSWECGGLYEFSMENRRQSFVIQMNILTNVVFTLELMYTQMLVVEALSLMRKYP